MMIDLDELEMFEKSATRCAEEAESDLEAFRSLVADLVSELDDMRAERDRLRGLLGEYQHSDKTTVHDAYLEACCPDCEHKRSRCDNDCNSLACADSHYVGCKIAQALKGGG